MNDDALILGDRTQALSELTSLGVLEWAARQAPNQVAVKDPGGGGSPELTWTYAELLGQSQQLAGTLARHFKPGDKVAIWGRNTAPWLLYMFAAARVGVLLVTLNPASRGQEVQYMLSKVGAKGLIMEREFRGNDLVATIDAIKPTLPELKTILYLDDWQRHVAEGHDDLPPCPSTADDGSIVVFTSGTTGKPKAAILSHRAMVNNAKLAAEKLRIRPHAVWLTSLPFFHVGGPVTMVLGAISQLGTQIIMPPWDPGVVLRLIEKERIDYSALVPAMVIALVEHPDFASIDTSSLKQIQVGGTTITPAFIKLVRERLGCKVQVVFGQTECCGEICKTPWEASDQMIEQTVGLPLPHMDIKIADAQTGEIVKRNVVGEIRVRGPYTTLGYYGDEAATKAVYDSERFLRTGDLGLVDSDGMVRITGRLKEMIIRGGENIYPREIEDALGEFPSVIECAVVGVPHEKWGEEVGVAVRASDPSIDLAAARAFLEDRLARHKVPKHWLLVEDFPRNTSGKIQKFEVRRFFTEPSE